MEVKWRKEKERGEKERKEERDEGVSELRWIKREEEKSGDKGKEEFKAESWR